MWLSNKVQTYLSRKQRGGEANNRGNTYENYFAVFKIISTINIAPNHLHSFFISSQVNGFVDDFHIHDQIGKLHSYYQLKTSAVLSWGKTFGSLSFNFNMQRKLETFRRRQLQLNLVVTDKQLSLSLERQIPKKIKTYTYVHVFPYFSSITQQIAQDLYFRQELQQICAVTDTDKLEALAKCFLGAWVACTQKGIRISTLINDVRGMGYSFIKSAIPLYINPQVHEIISTITGFKYTIKNGYFTWTYGKSDSGISYHMIDSQDFRNIEQDIITQSPRTFDDLETIISL
jgi:hypothetical protein